MTLQDIKEDAMTLGFKGNLSHINRLADKVYANPARVYELMQEYGIGADSVIREKLFSYIADKYHDGDYNKVYDKWIKS